MTASVLVKALPFVASAAFGATAGWALCRFAWLLDDPPAQLDPSGTAE